MQLCYQHHILRGMKLIFYRYCGHVVHKFMSVKNIWMKKGKGYIIAATWSPGTDRICSEVLYIGVYNDKETEVHFSLIYHRVPVLQSAQ